MILYYSNSQVPNSPQPIPEMSLGGYLSSSQVPPSGKNNLFGQVSTYTKQKGTLDVRGIFLKNDSSEPYVNLSIYWDYPTELASILKLEVGAVSPTGGNLMEKIPNGKTNPYYVEFAESTDSVNPILLTASLAPGSVIGLWFRRTIKASGAQSCDTLYEAYKLIVPPAELTNLNIPPAPVAPSNEVPNVVNEEILLHFSWE